PGACSLTQLCCVSCLPLLPLHPPSTTQISPLSLHDALPILFTQPLTHLNQLQVPLTLKLLVKNTTKLLLVFNMFCNVTTNCKILFLFWVWMNCLMKKN